MKRFSACNGARLRLSAFQVALCVFAFVGCLAVERLLHVKGAARSAVGALKTKHASVLKTIETITIGERVAWAENPAEPFDETLGREVDPATWRKITLRPDEHSRVVLLRPQWWIDERVDRTSGRLAVSVPEVGIAGDVEVVSIGPCPPLAQGRGPIVIGTFQHEAPGTILLTISGLAEPIRCTPNHAIWSHDRQQFVEAQSLRPSELVATRYGPHHVTSVTPHAPAATVYNLEILGQHVYQVSPVGVLVHNASPSGSGIPDLDALDRVVGEAKKRRDELAEGLSEADWLRQEAMDQNYMERARQMSDHIKRINTSLEEANEAVSAAIDAWLRAMGH